MLTDRCLFAEFIIFRCYASSIFDCALSQHLSYCRRNVLFWYKKEHQRKKSVGFDLGQSWICSGAFYATRIKGYFIEDKADETRIIILPFV
jgi:hypothetical protein